MRIQGGIPVGGNLGFYSQAGFDPFEYMPGRDRATARTMEWDYNKDGPYAEITPIGTAPLTPGQGQTLGGFPGAIGDALAGSPSFEINKRPGALGGRSGEQLRRLYEGGTQQNQQLNKEMLERGIMPGAGPKLPLAYGVPGQPGNAAGMANAEFYLGPQYAQLPQGFQNKTIYA
jgi:hypothetical protein